MLAWALSFIFASLVSGAVGWAEVSANTRLMGRLFFILFLVLFAVSFMSGTGVSLL